MNCLFKNIPGCVWIYLLLGVIFCCPYAAAVEKDVGQQWLVKSTYLDPMTGNTLPTLFWEFTKKVEKSAPVITVKDRSGKTPFRQELFFNSSDSLVRVDSFNIVRNRELVFTRSFDPEMPAVLEDSIIPSNWINVPLPWHTEPVVFSIKKSVGKHASFATRMRLSGQTIDPQQALMLNMITEELIDKIAGENLLLVIFEKINRKGEPEEILRQLWSSNIPFWLYEATATRKSWYIIE